MSYNRIHNKGPYLQEEALAGGAITPGHLIKLNSAGAVVVHSTSGGACAAAFAAEDALQGEIVTHAYASAERVTYILPGKGSVVNAMINSGADIAIGDLLMSNGDGTLIERTGTNTVVGVATEACDLTGSGAVDTLCAVRIV